MRSDAELNPKLEERAPGIFYCNEDLVRLNSAHRTFLIDAANRSPRKRARICAHQSPDDLLHEMLICLLPDSYVRPHKHYKPESLFWIAGQADLVLFDDQGVVTDVVSLGNAEGQHTFVRLNEPIFHTLLVTSSYLLFLETTTGPLRREDSVFAAWAASDQDPASAAQFTHQLKLAMEDWRGRCAGPEI